MWVYLKNAWQVLVLGRNCDSEGRIENMAEGADDAGDGGEEA